MELFAGAGGLALGLNRAGFRPHLLVELDRRAVETLRENAETHGGGWEVKQADVGEMDFSAYKSVDLVSAGPPCQPFSVGGLRLGSADHRDGFPATIKAIRESKPRAFVIENVRGLTFPAAKEYFDYILAQLRVPSLVLSGDEEAHRAALVRVPQSDHEYEVHCRLLNAADFGVAQQRTRLLIVGLRAPLSGWRWPDPTHGRDALTKALAGDEYWERHGVPAVVRDRHRSEVAKIRSALHGDSKGSARWLTTRDALAPLRDRPEVDDPAHKFVTGARLYPRHKGSLLDLPAKTVKAGVHGTPGGEHIVLLDDATHRYLTVRECALLQGFPDDYALPKLRSVALRQVGNAVPVQLAEAVGRAIAARLAKGD